MGYPAQASRQAGSEASGEAIGGWAREVLLLESRAIAALAERLEQGEAREALARVVRRVAGCAGCVLTTGMGKAGWVARKLSATLASTGVASHFVHPAEAIHGDFGRFRAGDLVLALSQSGETDEITRILPTLRSLGVALVAMTASRASTLARAADEVLELGPVAEACPHGLAPTTSTTVMMALGDALALGASRLRGFRAEDFARFHPGGSLGRKLARVEECMRPLAACRVASASLTVREVLIGSRKQGRRSGAILLVDGEGLLAGMFTDSDLARLLESDRGDLLGGPVAEVMTRRPSCVRAGTRMGAALELLAQRKFSELPVVDDRGAPLGLIDVTDVVGWSPSGAEEAAAPDDEGPRLVRFPSLGA